MTGRRTFIGGIACGLLLAQFKAHAQPTEKVRHIGLLSVGSSADPPAVNEAFRQRLRELGWVEGRNVVIDYRFAESRYDQLPSIAAELVRLDVDVIVAPTTPAAIAAKNATKTIPIVMVGPGDPVASGLVASLAHPGGNVTGLTYSGASMEIYAKQLELLREAVPKVQRVAILSNPANPAHPLWTRQIKEAGGSLGVGRQFVEARDPAEFDGAFAAIANEHAGALVVGADTLFLLQRKRIADLPGKGRLPMLGCR